MTSCVVREGLWDELFGIPYAARTRCFGRATRANAVVLLRKLFKARMLVPRSGLSSLCGRYAAIGRGKRPSPYL